MDQASKAPNNFNKKSKNLQRTWRTFEGLEELEELEEQQISNKHKARDLLRRPFDSSSNQSQEDFLFESSSKKIELEDILW